jgi:dipeptidase E
MSQKRLLLLSNSTNPGEPYLTWPLGHIGDFLGGRIKRVFFVPYAGVSITWDDYTARVRERFESLGIEVTAAHETAKPAETARGAEAVVVGGGNTWNLLKTLYDTEVLHAIKARVEEGAPYIGWSAGSNVACPTIKTTNDMPIVEPPSMTALGLVPFQINPHFTAGRLEGQPGETREERLAEFLEANPGIHVVGLQEGTALRVEGRGIEFLGSKPAKVFLKGAAPLECGTRDSLQFLLTGPGEPAPRFA